MNSNTRTLEDRLKFMMEYCEVHRVDRMSFKYQQYLADALQRYMFGKEKLEVLACVKKFYFSDELRAMYDRLVREYDLVVSETNRLMLIKCICLKEKLDSPGTSVDDVVDHQTKGNELGGCSQIIKGDAVDNTILQDNNNTCVL